MQRNLEQTVDGLAVEIEARFPFLNTSWARKTAALLRANFSENRCWHHVACAPTWTSLVGDKAVSWHRSEEGYAFWDRAVQHAKGELGNKEDRGRFFSEPPGGAEITPQKPGCGTSLSAKGRVREAKAAVDVAKEVLRQCEADLVAAQAEYGAAVAYDVKKANAGWADGTVSALTEDRGR